MLLRADGRHGAFWRFVRALQSVTVAARKNLNDVRQSRTQEATTFCSDPPPTADSPDTAAECGRKARPNRPKHQVEQTLFWTRPPGWAGSDCRKIPSITTSALSNKK